MNFRVRRRVDEIDVNMTPLIDVVFLLLIFFMVSTTFSRESRIGMELPTSVSEVPAPENPVEILVSADGSYRINGQQVAAADRDTLGKSLTQLADPKQPLVITADKRTEHEYLVRILDVAGGLGFSRINITTELAQSTDL